MIKGYNPITAIGVLVLWAASSFPSFAEVTVALNQGINWVGNPTIMVADQPSVNLNSVESNWGGSAPYSLGQSFTAPVSGVLTNIQLYVTGKNTTNVLYLYDMGPAMQYAVSQPAAIVPGSNGIGGNLFSTNLSVFVANMPNPNVIKLQFSGADAVPIIGGHQYYFNMVSLSSSGMWWHRDGGSTDLYPGGAAYRQSALINGSQKTDFSLAVSLVNTSAPPAIYHCVVDWNNVHQRIDGFGASSAWRSGWTSALADMFFSTNSGTGTTLDGQSTYPFVGIGLSLLRTRVNTNGTGTYENSIMQMAQTRGARVWSAPWSPPPQFKSNGNVNGGNFLSANNQAYASVLAQYVVNMQNSYGVNIYALSVQNEPDLATSYESCVWTPQQIHDFVPYLRSALNAAGKSSVKIIAAEGQHWETNLYAAALSDPAVATNVNIIACHNYDNSPPSGIPAALPRYANTNAVLWETEVSKLAGNGAFDPGMGDAIYWAGRLHLFMTTANVSAWHYWWLVSNNPDNEGLTDLNGIPAKRMYVLGQYSRFVRPNNYRINLANYNPYAVFGSAYKDPVSGSFAIVIANTNSAAMIQSFYLTNFVANSVTPWITSSDLSLAAQTPVAVTNGTFSYVIPALSVVTFAGTGIFSPTDITLSGSSVLEGQAPGTVVGSFSTVDPGGGGPFAYALVAGSGGTDNASFTINNNNLYTAASFNYLAQNSYSIRVRSTTQNNQWVEKMFTISVTPRPNTPVNLAPAAGAVNQPLTATLQSSAFSDLNAGSTQVASEWLVQRTPDNTIVFDSAPDTTHLVSITLPPNVLDYETSYLWQVRYRNNYAAWSAYSSPTLFTTLAPTLGVISQAENMVLSWPADAAGYSLKYSTNLTDPNWIPFPDAPTVVGSQYVITNTISDSPMMYFKIEK